MIPRNRLAYLLAVSPPAAPAVVPESLAPPRCACGSPLHLDGGCRRCEAEADRQVGAAPRCSRCGCVLTPEGSCLDCDRPLDISEEPCGGDPLDLGTPF